MLSGEIESFLLEDVGHEDYELVVPSVSCRAEIIAKEEGVLAGLEEAAQIFAYLGVQTESSFNDGDMMRAEDVVMTVSGNAQKILKGERLVLNFLGRMSGIATLTRAFVDAAREVNPRIKIAGTRKTTPGFRKYEKKAIIIGGGDPHRFGLFDAMIIKDNHIKIMGLEDAINVAKKRVSFSKKIEVEVESVEHAIKAAEMNVDIIMLDNMSVEDVRLCVEELERRGIRDKVLIEASGGITLENVRDYAETGVDVISSSALTRSAKFLGFSLEVV
ncbi:MAG: carboxylating nicotinate-nucleotide diphosphorylase [Canidatus Methanoxibalbensis ujae]|nr:carboxylating nicotinate-nucleotide diphosphorylase [Candidatus Methanoxibalbensis ujae]MCW7078888.1 carboxylating nicotinate-nucleotide diphosphorylase [Candidatus Methanoxibalbensis ujae]